MKSKISRRVDSICFKFNRAYAKSLLLGLLREVYQGITRGIAKFPCSNHQFFRFKSDLDLAFQRIRLVELAQSSIHLVEFRSVMLATLRSLCPKDWDTDHEVRMGGWEDGFAIGDVF